MQIRTVYNRIKSKCIVSYVAILKKYLLSIGFRCYKDHWIYEMFMDASKPVIDIGANAGDFSSIISKNYNSRCFAIEPNPSFHEKIQNFNDSNIILKKFAVSSLDGPVNFHLSSNPEASSLYSNIQLMW